MEDKGCICKGNWRKIIKESEPFFDNYYLDKKGVAHCFAGVMWSYDDYYYCLLSKAEGLKMLSCVGSIEDRGYKIVKKRDKR